MQPSVVIYNPQRTHSFVAARGYDLVDCAYSTVCRFLDFVGASGYLVRLEGNDAPKEYLVP